MAALRTQVYFTPEQRKRLDEIARHEGSSLAEVVRAAVDAYTTGPAANAKEILEESFGAVPDAEAPSRADWAERERRLGV